MIFYRFPYSHKSLSLKKLCLYKSLCTTKPDFLYRQTATILYAKYLPLFRFYASIPSLLRYPLIFAIFLHLQKKPDWSKAKDTKVKEEHHEEVEAE